MAKCKDDHWPGASSEKDSADTRRHSVDWQENMLSVALFLLCPLSLLNYLCVISLSLFPSLSLCLLPSLGWLVYRSVFLWQSLTEAARFTTCQVPYLRPRVRSYWFSRGRFIIILVKNTPSISSVTLGCHAQHFENIYRFLLLLTDSLTLYSQKQEVLQQWKG